MPAALSYPGVYVDEVPSNVRTITGVPTAICAFLGRTPTGPVDTPVIINSLADYDRVFGGLSANSQVSYSVRDFFLNGGGQAVVVRVYTAPGVVAGTAADGIARFTIAAAPNKTPPAFTFQAASPGIWANSLKVAIAAVTDTAVGPALGFPAGTEIFDVIIKSDSTTVLERIRNVTFADTSRRVDRVLAAESSLLRIPANAVPDAGNTNTKVINYVTTDASAGDIGADSVGLTTSAHFVGNQANKTGLYALEKTDLFNLLVIPSDTRGVDLPSGVLTEALKYCVDRRAMLIVDPLAAWTSVANVNLGSLGLSGLNTRNAAVFFPRILEADPLRGGQLDTFPPSGAIAGVIAATDARRGIFKAPAGIDAGIVGARGLSVGGGNPFALTDAENGQLNPLGVNCLRVFPNIGPVVWGARTLRGADQLADDYKYLPVRRLVLFIEESLYRGTKFAVFEPNDEPLWSQIRLNVGAFMQNLFRQGAFQGQSPREAYFVKCDKESTTQNDINQGIVNIIVGFAPLKPAEFVVIKIQQIAGQIAT